MPICEPVLLEPPEILPENDDEATWKLENFGLLTKKKKPVSEISMLKRKRDGEFSSSETGPPQYDPTTPHSENERAHPAQEYIVRLDWSWSGKRLLVVMEPSLILSSGRDSSLLPVKYVRLAKNENVRVYR